MGESSAPVSFRKGTVRVNGHPVGEALKVDGRWRFEADTGRVFVESRRADLAPHARRARQALIDAGEG